MEIFILKCLKFKKIKINGHIHCLYSAESKYFLKVKHFDLTVMSMHESAVQSQYRGVNNHKDTYYHVMDSVEKCFPNSRQISLGVVLQHGSEFLKVKTVNRNMMNMDLVDECGMMLQKLYCLAVCVTTNELPACHLQTTDLAWNAGTFLLHTMLSMQSQLLMAPLQKRP